MANSFAENWPWWILSVIQKRPGTCSYHQTAQRQRPTFELLLYGLRSFDGQDFNLQVATPNDASNDQQRRAVLDKLKLGLTPYLLRTNLADSISANFDAPVTQFRGSGRHLRPLELLGISQQSAARWKMKTVGSLRKHGHRSLPIG